MNADFHYYATYCASIIAGFNEKEAERIAYSANFVDCCTKTILKKCKAPLSAATTQSQIELVDMYTDILGIQEITRIWASFHFLPGDLYQKVNHGFKNYKNRYRLICKPNSDLIRETVELAKGQSLEAIGIAMHILADSWAHQNFAGTPSLVINNIEKHIYEIVDDHDYLITFHHNPAGEDDIENRRFQSSIYRGYENSIMNLGHGRIGHIADLSYIKYRYMPAWGRYNEIIRDNQNDFYFAFSQMVEALKYLKGTTKSFELNKYAPLPKYEEKIKSILAIRQLNDEKQWKEFAKDLSGIELKDFDVEAYQEEYINAKEVKKTNFNNFIIHALKQKSMVTNRIYKSKNLLAGYSIEYNGSSLKGLKDYWQLLEEEIKVNHK